MDLLRNDLGRIARFGTVDRDEAIAGLERAVEGGSESRVRLTVDRHGRIRVAVSPLSMEAAQH